MTDAASPSSRAMILDKLGTVLAEITAQAAPPPSESTRLREDLGLDSFAAIELVFEVEDQFDVRIPQNVAVGFQTIGDVVTYIAAELAHPRAPAADVPEGVRVGRA